MTDHDPALVSPPRNAVVRAERNREILRRARECQSASQIAEELRIPEPTVYSVIRKEKAKVQIRTQEEVAGERGAQLDRLDYLIGVWWNEMTKPIMQVTEDNDLIEVSTAQSIKTRAIGHKTLQVYLAQRALLLGLNAPTQIESKNLHVSMSAPATVSIDMERMARVEGRDTALLFARLLREYRKQADQAPEGEEVIDGELE
jgi:DNA-binding CsgD family transcriptional regulator